MKGVQTCYTDPSQPCSQSPHPGPPTAPRCDTWRPQPGATGPPKSGLGSPSHSHSSAGLSLHQPYSDLSQLTPQISAVEGQGREWGAREKHHELHPQDGSRGGGSVEADRAKRVTSRCIAVASHQPARHTFILEGILLTSGGSRKDLTFREMSAEV